ncbi:hypothetical protein KGQ31_01160 [Patescibacteria group bacterium]|nr:hypothetical protein [Patescibacteria group bacterium]
MLSQEALQKILGIEGKVSLTPEEMADQLNITFFPHRHAISKNVAHFAEILADLFVELKVNVIPYDEALETVPYWKMGKRFGRLVINDILALIEKIFRLPERHSYIELKALRGFIKRRLLKKGIAVIALGEQKTGALPMEYIRSFKDNSVISILDFPAHISEDSSFFEHFDTAMGMFAYHMTNIVIAVDDSRWMLYNFNASHPIYAMNRDFKENVLHALIPKIVAPISPHSFADFAIKKNFDINDTAHRLAVADLVEGAALFDKTKLYPAGKRLDDLSWRSPFYRFIGKLHLDNRNGMSFGFLARQLPVKLSEVTAIEKVRERFGDRTLGREKDFFLRDGKLYAVFQFEGQTLCLSVPEVAILSQRSGSDKTHVVPERDLVKLGLAGGVMSLAAPKGLALDNNYRPSFDTKVMLAHAAGNAIVASILKFKDKNAAFAKQLETTGAALAHWHGYFDPKAVPEGFPVYGSANLHVACSSPQSALYALDGKLAAFLEFEKTGKEYKGDIHIEPHHGSNVTFASLVSLSRFLLEHPRASLLGNRYLYHYPAAR